MSSHHWNTKLEQLRLEQLLKLTTFLIAKDTKDTLDDGDSSLSSCFADDALCVTVLYNHYINDVQEESVWIEFGRRPLVRDFDNVTCLSEFCFRKQDLQHLENLLWPQLAVDLPGVREDVVVKNKYRVPFETGLLLVLYRFVQPHKVHGDMETFFGMRRSHICATISTFVNVLYNFSFKFLNNPAIYKPRMPMYVALIEQKIGIVDNIWGFIDGTLRKTCRPTAHQRIVYSGHKRATDSSSSQL
jgi:hypothetical protein